MPARRKKGKGWFSDAAKSAWNKVKEVAKAAHDVAKERKVVSKALSNMGHSGLADVAKKLGYGKKRRRRRVAGRGGLAIAGPMGIGMQIGRGRRRGRGLAENEKVLVM
jgi:hypothetical protein